MATEAAENEVAQILLDMGNKHLSPPSEAEDLLKLLNELNKDQYNLEESSRTKSRRQHKGAVSEAFTAETREKELDEALVGSKIKVWRPADDEFCDGVVDSFDPISKKHKITYFDGDEEILFLKDECWEYLQDNNKSDFLRQQMENSGSDATPNLHMDDPLSIPCSQSGTDARSTQKKGRGATRLKELTLGRSGNQLIPIEFDDLTGNPLGTNRKKFKSFVALLGRSKASILVEDWDHVEESVKNQIWQSILLTFDVPDTKFQKRKCITFAGERWRAFKTQLTSRYIFGSLKDTSPCEKYTFLEEETWQRFVESRQNSAFQEKRKKAQIIQAKNIHPHKLSRGGYELLEERITQEKLEQCWKTSQSDPALVIDPPSPPTRHEKWKRARQQKSGEYTSEDTRLVAEKIDSLVEQSLQGSFVQYGRQDILTTAIGRPEHPGRVRAAGRGVGIRQYFGAKSGYGPTSGAISRKEFEVFRKEMREDLRRELRQVFNHELASMGLSQQKLNSQPSISPIMSTKGIYNCAAENISEEDHISIPIHYELYIDDPHRLVAIGKICSLGSTIYHKRINDGMGRVLVEEVRDTNARVPVPTKEVQTVGQALNNLILWPRRLMKHVSHKDINDGSNKEVPPKILEQLEPLNRLCLVAMKIGREAVKINLEHEILEGYFYITQRDIMELCMGTEMLCVSVLQLWLTYLHRLCISKGILHLYGFFDPIHIQGSGNKAEKIRAYMQNMLSEGRKEFYLAPYINLAHWQLLIICPRQNFVVFFCSLGHKQPIKGFKNLVELAMEAVHVLENRRSTSKKKPTWICPNSQRQCGSYECGYYVMRHMLNIISASIVDLWEERFNNPDPFSEKEINDVRERWANFFLHITNNLG